MWKLSTILLTLPLLSPSAFAEATRTEDMKVQLSEQNLTIRPEKNPDALAYKHIYREIEVSKNIDQILKFSYVSEDESSNLKVQILKNSCLDSSLDKCSFIVQMRGEQGDYKGHISIEDLSSESNPLTLSLNIPVQVTLIQKYFSDLKQKSLLGSQQQTGPVNAPVVKFKTCEDLKYIDPYFTNACKTTYKILTAEKTFHEKNLDHIKSEGCSRFPSQIERSTCEGSMTGLLLSGCGSPETPLDLDEIGLQTCKAFHNAASKSCDKYDFECASFEKMLHGYLDCADSDYYPYCIAYQNAYVEGISPKWLKENFIPHVKKNPDTGLASDNENTLAYINPQSIESLDLSNDDLKLLINRYPTLSRSVLLNRDFSRSYYKGLSKKDIWKEITTHLYPAQTVGYELECPAVRLDLSSGQDLSKIYDHVTGYLNFDDLISNKERQNKKLIIDSLFEKYHQSYLSELRQYGVWNDKEASFPYFNTYGSTLFASDKTQMKIPLVSATMESRYAYNHFPHIEMVTAPLTETSSPLNHKNAMAYIADLLKPVCEFDEGSQINSMSLPKWHERAETVMIPNSSSSLKYELAKEPYFTQTPMFCMRQSMKDCHVQSNVGVYYHQFFTDSFLIQSIGSNYPYNTDAVYRAAWTVAKRIFSILQWDEDSDKLVDARNHAAGIFTYFVYELYLKSILYAGDFDFWKGTLSHLMKYELRSVWGSLKGPYSDENERRLFQKAVLSLWMDKKLPDELAQLTESVLNQFILTGQQIDTPTPKGKYPYYSKNFAEKVNGIFKELIWTIGLSDNSTYAKSTRYSWGSVVSEGTNLNYYDPVSGTMKKREGFTYGCDYASHNGTQCDIAKVIDPYQVSIEHNGKSHPAQTIVVETRYGNADFNQSLFWRCHENNRSGLLKHYCY